MPPGRCQLAPDSRGWRKDASASGLSSLLGAATSPRQGGTWVLQVHGVTEGDTSSGGSSCPGRVSGARHRRRGRGATPTRPPSQQGWSWSCRGGNAALPAAVGAGEEPAAAAPLCTTPPQTPPAPDSDAPGWRGDLCRFPRPLHGPRGAEPSPLLASLQSSWHGTGVGKAGGEQTEPASPASWWPSGKDGGCCLPRDRRQRSPSALHRPCAPWVRASDSTALREVGRYHKSHHPHFTDEETEAKR